MKKGFQVRVSNEQGIEVNFHCTALRNDFIGHKIIVMVLSWFKLTYNSC